MRTGYPFYPFLKRSACFIYFTFPVYGWKFRYSVFLITDSNIPVPTDNHPVVEKQEPSLRHGAHYLLESTCPDKGLLSHRCVEVRILFLEVIAPIFNLTMWVFMVPHV